MTDTVEPTFPVSCEHGRHVGWAYRSEPDVIVSRRMSAPCLECEDGCPND
jgi:hypothetical protein